MRGEERGRLPNQILEVILQLIPREELGELWLNL